LASSPQGKKPIYKNIFCQEFIFQKPVLQSPAKINARKSLFHAGFMACAILSFVSRST
jgi:hypothetical protein